MLPLSIKALFKYFLCAVWWMPRSALKNRCPCMKQCVLGPHFKVYHTPHWVMTFQWDCCCQRHRTANVCVTPESVAPSFISRIGFCWQISHAHLCQITWPGQTLTSSMHPVAISQTRDQELVAVTEGVTQYQVNVEHRVLKRVYEWVSFWRRRHHLALLPNHGAYSVMSLLLLHCGKKQLRKCLKI